MIIALIICVTPEFLVGSQLEDLKVTSSTANKQVAISAYQLVDDVVSINRGQLKWPILLEVGNLEQVLGIQRHKKSLAIEEFTQRHHTLTMERESGENLLHVLQFHDYDGAI